jgi:hypothetical protein
MLWGLPALLGLLDTPEDHNNITNYERIEFHSGNLLNYGIPLSITKQK